MCPRSKWHSHWQKQRRCTARHAGQRGRLRITIKIKIKITGFRRMLRISLPRFLPLGAMLTLGLLSNACADDWPQWMGPQRDGVWREKNILQQFPGKGLQIRWRTNVNRGYCGPAVVRGQASKSGSTRMIVLTGLGIRQDRERRRSWRAGGGD